MIKLLRKQQTDRTESICRQLDVQSAQIFKIMANIRDLNNKLDEMNTKLNKISRGHDGDIGVETITTKDKTKEAIKLILKRYGRMTSSMLGNILRLSRTRSSEYLKELERDGTVVCKISNRKKYYLLK